MSSTGPFVEVVVEGNFGLSKEALNLAHVARLGPAYDQETQRAIPGKSIVVTASGMLPVLTGPRELMHRFNRAIAAKQVGDPKGLAAEAEDDTDLKAVAATPVVHLATRIPTR